MSAQTQALFGDEWTRFPTIEEAHEKIFRWYFEGPEPIDWLPLTVLDAGCGMGRWLHFARRAGAQVVGLDLSPAVDVAARREGEDAALVQGDLRDPPFAAGKFDLVYSLGVVHHLEDPARAVRILADLVRPGGELRLYVYRSLEDEAWIRRMLLGGVTLLRRGTVRLTPKHLHAFSWTVAAVANALFLLPHRLGRRIPGLGRWTERLPLTQYTDVPFRMLVAEQFDRFGAPLEGRFRREDVEGWLRGAALEVVAVLPGLGWRAIARKPASSPSNPFSRQHLPLDQGGAPGYTGPTSGRPAPPSAVPRPGTTRILRLFSRLNIGGPSVHVILLTAGLGAKGYETQLVVGRESPSEGNLLTLAEARGVRPVHMEGLGREIRPFADLLVLWQLWRIIRSFRPAIVHTHTAKAGAVGRLAAWLAGVPVIAHTYHGHVLRGYFGPLKTTVYRLIERALDTVTDAPITVSEALRAELAALKVSRAEKMRVVPLGLDLARFTRPHPRGGLRAADGIGEAAPLIGVVGRLVPIKDVATFLAAAVRVRVHRPEARFAIVGDGELRPTLERQVGELGLGPAVRFHGWRTDLEAVYADLDVVVNSSLNEGTPVALIEALAAGRPVVATAVGGTPDLLARGAHGALVPAGDPEALAAAILDTLSRPQESRRRAETGRAYVLAHHSAERLIDDIDALYRELLGRRLEVA